MGSKGRVYRAVAAAFCLALAAIAWADITTTGDAGAYGSDYYVGRNADGTLRIDLGSPLTSQNLYLGYSVGCTGAATVTGAGSKWTSPNVYAGYSGNGTLNIEGGGEVINGVGYLGWNAGSTGTAMVTGTGSKWTNSYNLYIGYSGTGSLTVADGGLVTTKMLWASLSDLHGDGTVAASGAVLDGDVIFDLTHGSTAAAAFGSGGTLNLNMDGTERLGVGYKGTGTLRIAEGVSVASSYGYLGYSAGSEGAATVTGVGSKWTNGSTLFVGNSGSGTLTIEAGAQVSNSYMGYLGYNAGSMGTATITGIGSKWTNDGDLYVGYSGTGSLTVADGGVVTAKTLWASLSDLHGNGTIAAMGAVLDADLVFDSAHGLRQSISFGSGGTLNLGIQSYGAGSLGVGHKGAGTLRIAEGLSVVSSSGYLGYGAGSQGAATVTGAGSKWTNTNDLYVGRSGSGSLTVDDGGLVTAKTLWASLSDLHGNGAIAVSGGMVLDADLLFGSGHGLTQSMGFGSGGTLNLSVNSGNPMGVGYKGTGTLRIADGVTVASSYGYLGYNAGAVGTATVAGTNSKWTNTADFYVGRSGSGTLVIQAGGQVGANIGYLGYTAGSMGTATVTGTGSKWLNTTDLYIGYSGSGTLNLEAGGQASNTGLYGSYLGYDSGSTGAVTVTGIASKWTNNWDLNVGYSGTGTLNIEAGGQISSTLGYLGYNPGSTGMARVTGTGSTWTTYDLYVGYFGSGAMSIEAGGQASAGNSSLGCVAGSTGAATVTGSGSKWTNTGDLQIGNFGSGTLKVEAGGQVSDRYGHLGYSAGSTGAATVTGTGASWTNTYELYVGRSGSGTLNIEAGGKVSNGYYGYLGYDLGSLGTATVKGTGSKWMNTAELHVGDSGNGTLNIESGGQVSNTYGYLGYKAGSVGMATVTGVGSTWTSGSDLFVGFAGNGTLNVEAGGQVGDRAGYLGYGTGTNGAATVTGAGSKWTNTGELFVGGSGNGSLTVSDGGLVTTKLLWASLSDLHGNGTISASGAVLDGDVIFDLTHGSTFGSGGMLDLCRDGTERLGIGYKGTGTLRIAEGLSVVSSSGYLGYSAGSQGAATVTGVGSKWANGSTLFVGNSGSGTLSIEAGGQVLDAKGYLGYNGGLMGTATVTGTGSKWTNSSDLYVGYSGSGTLNIQAGGLVSNLSSFLGCNAGSAGTATVTGSGSKWTNTYDLYLGNSGSGTLNIESGGQIGSRQGYLGYNSGSTGTATVTGTGSSWTNTVGLYIGCSGKGALSIESGGQVSNTEGDLGYSAGSTGTAAVTGSGSKWTNSRNLYVGRYGAGALSIESGGQVSNVTGYLGQNAGSQGAATVTGAGSMWINGADLFVGNSASGALSIEAGGQVSNIAAYLGYNSGATGTATVTGAGSTWTNSSHLYVGYSGSGSLTVADGGLVTARTLWASLGDLHGNGTITAGSAVVDGAIVFDGMLGSTAIVAFGSGGGLNLSASSSGPLGVGYKGTGTLRIAGGLSVGSSSGYLGYHPGSRGTATVTGPGSKWTNSSGLYVGYSGNGTLSIESGGQVSNTEGDLGYSAGSTGTATVTGSGAKWTNSSGLYVGYSGNGTLNVEAGSQVSNTAAYLGYNASSTGTATVTGAGSKWTNSSVLYAGYVGNGALSIESGGQVSNVTGYLGYNSGSTGTATVTGAGSKWTNSSVLYVGCSGNGALSIESGGQVSNTVAYLGYSPGRTGTATVTVTGAGSKWTNSSGLYVGYYGKGALSIESGGQVSNTDGFLGYNSGSTGTATVMGAASEWTNSSVLYVGYSGSGSLTVADGGLVTARTLWASLSDLHGNGTITAGSGVFDADLVFDNGHGLTQSMPFGSGGTLNLNVSSANPLGVGYKGTGTLRIAGGLSVGASYGYLGYNAGSMGTATVTGTGSKWTNSSDLYVGRSGSGSLTVADGGVVTAQTLWASLSDLHGNGTIAAGGAVLDADLLFDSSHGLTQSMPFGSGGTLNLNVSSANPLGVGYKGTGTLRIADGLTVGSSSGYLGYNSGSTGTITVSGAGSKWTNSGNLNVGSGSGGAGTLNIADHGQVLARSASVNTWSAARLHVSGNNMLVLGDAATAGTLTNYGSLGLYADPFLPAGNYWPFSEYARRTITWSGTGTISAFGGAWNNTTKAFSVPAPTALLADAMDTLTTGERLLFTDPATGQRIGASFGIIPAASTFSADLLSDADLAALATAPAFSGDLLAGWDFQTTLAATEVMLSFDLGAGLDSHSLAIWHLKDGQWTRFTPKLQTYDEHGILSFTATDFSGYAVAAIPEPASLTLLLLAPLACCRRKTRPRTR